MSRAQHVEDLKNKLLPGIRERLMLLMEKKIPDYRKEKGIPLAMDCILVTMAYEFAALMEATNTSASKEAP